MNDKRRKAEARIKKMLADIDTTGRNTELYTEMFSKMTDKKFDAFMKDMRDSKTKLFVMLPNMDNSVTMNDIMELAEKYDVQCFDHLWLRHPSTGRKYLSKNKYLMLNLPVRRVKQYLFNKMSLPDSDEHVDLFTGQVMGKDKGAKVTDIETKILANKGLDTALVELLKMRGGDIKLYQEAKRHIEETGELSWDDLSLDSKTRSVAITDMYLRSLMLDNNLGG